MNKWNRLGNTLVVAAKYDFFGNSVPMSVDGKTVSVGAHHDNDNGFHSGHARVFIYSFTTKSGIF